MSEHHHHDDGQRVRTIYAVAIGIIILMAAALFWVTQSKGTKAHAGHGHAKLVDAHAGHGHAKGQGHAISTPRARLVRPTARRAPGRRGTPQVVEATPKARARFAQTMQLRVRRHDETRMVLATGQARDILEMRFPKGAEDQQLARFQKATQLFSELKGYGFRQMRIRSGRRVIFTKNL